MRQSELIGLRWDDVDLENGTILVCRQIQKSRATGKYVHLDETKNGKQRIAAIAPSVVKILKEQKRQQMEWQLAAGELWQNSERLVFTDEMGRHIRHNTMLCHFKDIVTSIGRPNVRFHDLRHSYAISALQAGDSVKNVQEQLGHYSSAFTMDIYAAVSDPAGAGLTGYPNVTGVSDALNTPFILDMMFTVNPDIQTVGLLYSNSEPNSELPIKEAKEYLDAKGIAYIEKTGTNADEVITAASALVGRCDAVFTPTDNAVMNVAPAVAEILNKGGIPHYTGADSFVTSGSFTTCGVNYTELGTHAAKMAMEILLDGNVPAHHVMDGCIITFNSETAVALGLDPATVADIFSTMANTVVDCTK
jgi:hypothetical protein